MGRRALFAGPIAAALLAGVSLRVHERNRIPDGLTVVNGRIEPDSGSTSFSRSEEPMAN
jgi:hypothetical protein